MLLTEASGSGAQVGRAALWKGEVDDCCYQNTVIRFRPHSVRPEYSLLVFQHYGASGVFARAAREVVSNTSGPRALQLYPSRYHPLKNKYAL